MRDTADPDTPADHLEAAVLGVREPSEVDGQRVGQELEGLRHGRGHHGALAESARGVLGPGSRGAGAVSVWRQRGADEVLVDLLWIVMLVNRSMFQRSSLLSREIFITRFPFPV